MPCHAGPAQASTSVDQEVEEVMRERRRGTAQVPAEKGAGEAGLILTRVSYF